MEKRNLLIDICIPFCTGRCVYCERQKYGQNVSWLHRYARALEKEISSAAEELEEYHIRSVHIHCDSLSLFGAGALDNFIGKLKKLIPSGEDTEWVAEMMPQELTDEFLHVLVNRNQVNRIRLELMGTTREELTALRRPYTVNLADHAIKYIGEHPISGLGVELAIGIPGQTPDMLLKSLEKAAGLGTVQISLVRYHNNRDSHERQREYAEETDWHSYIRAAQEFLEKRGFVREGKSLHFAQEGRILAADSAAAADWDRMGFGLGAVTQMDGLYYHNTTDIRLYLEHSDDPQAIAIL